MDSLPEEKLVFDAEWYQAEAAVTRSFVLNFFTKDNSIELVDTKAKKFFLRRTPVDTICARDLFPGSRVFVFGRKIHVTDYGNPETKLLLKDKSQKAFLLVPGQHKNILHTLFRKISKLNVKLDKCFMRQISSDDLIKVKLLEDDKIAPIKYNILNEPSVLFEVSGRSIDKKILDIEEGCPGVFGSQSETIIDYFFGSSSDRQKLPSNENNRDSVVCVIKPHILKTNRTGDLLAKIFQEGFVLTNIKLCHLDRSECEEFFRIYEGVLPEFIQMSLHLASGPLIAMELTIGDDQEIHSKFRNFCGPYDSEIAKKLRPHTLRAEFGVDNICNAVHCTDLKEDVKRELEFFFG